MFGSVSGLEPKRVLMWTKPIYKGGSEPLGTACFDPHCHQVTDVLNQICLELIQNECWYTQNPSTREGRSLLARSTLRWWRQTTRLYREDIKQLGYDFWESNSPGIGSKQMLIPAQSIYNGGRGSLVSLAVRFTGSGSSVTWRALLRSTSEINQSSIEKRISASCVKHFWQTNG